MRVLPLGLLCAIAIAGAARGEVTAQEALRTQLAGALASADYVARKCPMLRIDQNKIDALTARSGLTPAQLQKSEDYADQREALLSLEQSQSRALICLALTRAHGGYARGIITR